MDEHTRTELQFLSRWYALVRSSTLRLLHEMEDEELAWQPSAAGRSSGSILAHLAVSEELRIQRRLAGREMLPEAMVRAYQSCALHAKHRAGAPAKQELELLLKKLKTATLRFVRGLVFGRRSSHAPDVVDQLEWLIFHENQHLGQVRYLRALRSRSGRRSRRRQA